jgi:hypothetical protein
MTAFAYTIADLGGLLWFQLLRYIPVTVGRLSTYFQVVGTAALASRSCREAYPGPHHERGVHLLARRNVGGGCCDCPMAKRDGKSRRPTARHLPVLRQLEQAADIDIMNRYTEEVRWEILLLEPVNDWFLALCKDDPLTADKIEEALDELALCGPQLGRPLVDRIHGSKIHNLKELRPRVPGTAEVRLLFVFDAEREAIVLVAGDKAGRWRTWYAEAIPLAEERYAAYQREADEEDE